MAFEPFPTGSVPTLVDVARRTDPTGKIAVIAEVLTTSNPILADIPMVQANQATSHVSTLRSAIPTPVWRRLNYGVKPQKSDTVQVTDTMGMLATASAVDARIAELNGNSAEFRASEDRPHLEGLSRMMAQTLFYGDPVYSLVGAGLQFLGLSPRYDDLSFNINDRPPAIVNELLPNILSAGGTTPGKQMSVWYVNWGTETVHGIYAKGWPAGIYRKDEGQVMLQDMHGGIYPGYRTYFEWHMGLCVRDWRAVGRVCNIEFARYAANPGLLTTDLVYKLIDIMYSLPPEQQQRGTFYCHPALLSLLDRAAMESKILEVGYDQVFGQRIMTFRGRPIKPCHALLSTEAVIS